MITPAEADRMILETLPPFGTVRVPLDEAYGQVLRETLTADRDLPPFDRVTMDGVALCFDAWQKGCRAFSLESTATAGKPSPALRDLAGGCVQVMTGAMLPAGADTIIPFEEVTIEGDQVTVHGDARPAPLQYLHSRGSDKRAGEAVLQPGTRLMGPHIALAAAVGRPELEIARRPAVAIISTGDELKQVHEPVEPFQIRSANDRGMRASLLACGYQQVDTYTIHDDLEATVTLLERLLSEYGTLILTGGVSMGKKDFVPAALDRVGVRQVFHKIRQRPGKPMWFGLHHTNKPVFALPGNTVSTLVCLHRYVIPSLDAALGLRPTPATQIKLRESIRFTSPLTGFIPVRVQWTSEGDCLAEPVTTNTSGDFAALSETDGFVELPEGQDVFPAGHVVRYVAWR